MSDSLPPVVLITGAAGGLGQGLVSEFAAQGWRVVAAYHRATTQVATETILPIALDVTNRSRVAEVIDQVISRWGRIDALINNAGTTEDQLSTQLSESDWDKVLDVNLKGAFLCSQAVIRPMMKQRDGHIINLSSFVARTGRAGQANYAAAKAGLIGLTESIAQEVGSRNVRVNAVLPGVLPTGMTAKLSPEQLQTLAGANVLNRLNDVAEVARFIVYLTGMKNVSGQFFQLDSRITRWA